MDVSGQVHAQIYTTEEPRYPLNRRSGGAQRRNRRFGKETNFFPCPDSNRGLSSPQLMCLKQDKTLTLSPLGTSCLLVRLRNGQVRGGNYLLRLIYNSFQDYGI